MFVSATRRAPPRNNQTRPGLRQTGSQAGSKPAGSPEAGAGPGNVRSRARPTWYLVSGALLSAGDLEPAAERGRVPAPVADILVRLAVRAEPEGVGPRCPWRAACRQARRQRPADRVPAR